jgi:hypothetical protein
MRVTVVRPVGGIERTIGRIRTLSRHTMLP